MTSRQCRTLYEYISSQKSQVPPVDVIRDWSDMGFCNWTENMFYLATRYYLKNNETTTAVVIGGIVMPIVTGTNRSRVWNALLTNVCDKDDYGCLVFLIMGCCDQFNSVCPSEECMLHVLNYCVDKLWLFWIVFDRFTNICYANRGIIDVLRKLGYTHTDCYPSLGGKISPEILHKFPEIVQSVTVTDCDIVVDGANVGFYDIGSGTPCVLNYLLISRMYDKLKRFGYIKPLFVFNDRHKKSLNFNLLDLPKYYTPPNVNDDLFFVYIAMHKGVMVVTNDDLNDMCLSIDERIRDWIARHRACYRFTSQDLQFYHKRVNGELFRMTELHPLGVCVINPTTINVTYLESGKVEFVTLTVT
jgi:hypothetical protein